MPTPEEQLFRFIIALDRFIISYVTARWEMGWIGAVNWTGWLTLLMIVVNVGCLLWDWMFVEPDLSAREASALPSDPLSMLGPMPPSHVTADTPLFDIAGLAIRLLWDSEEDDS